MRLAFYWDDETGETKVEPESLETLQAIFEDELPVQISALDFLRDVVGIAVNEYNDALSAFNNRAEQEILNR